MADRNRVPAEEVYRALCARIILADEHLLAAGLIMAGLKKILPEPREQNMESARHDLNRALERYEAVEAGIEALEGDGADFADLDAG